MFKRALIGAMVLAGLGLAGAAAAGSAAPETATQSPLYAYEMPVDAGPTLAEARLGEKLFNDKRLSADGTVACATCHVAATGFVDHKPKAVGIHNAVGTRNSPTIFNAMFNDLQFWDGRARTLEDQATLPILNPIEMGQKTPADVMKAALAVPEYAAAFQKLLGHAPTYGDLTHAIASFEREQIGTDSRFDKFLAGDEHALSTQEQRGWALFNGKARCLTCHAFSRTEPFFTDQKFHNIGIAANDHDFVALARKAVLAVDSNDKRAVDDLALSTSFSELGRFLVTKDRGDIGAFKTPTLRNVAATGPYMHDGSMATLWDVMDHYNKGGIVNPFLDGGMQRLGLTEKEIDDLVAFMGALTSARYETYAAQELAKQRALARTSRPQRDRAVVDGKRGDLGDLAPDPTRDPATLGVY